MTYRLFKSCREGASLLLLLLFLQAPEDSRQFIHSKDLDDDNSTTPGNFNNRQDEYSESDDEPLLPPSRKSVRNR